MTDEPVHHAAAEREIALASAESYARRFVRGKRMDGGRWMIELGEPDDPSRAGVYVIEDSFGGAVRAADDIARWLARHLVAADSPPRRPVLSERGNAVAEQAEQ